MQDNEKLLRKYKSLKQYSNFSDEELLKVIEAKSQELEILDNLTFCIDDKEKKYAKDLLDKYLKDNNIENSADLDTLTQLVDLQILIERIKDTLKKDYSKANPIIQLPMVKELRDTEAQVLLLKEKLGLVRKDGGNSTGIKEWEILKKKCLNYYKSHAGETTTRCPKCNHLFRLLLRVNDKDSVKSSFFSGTRLYNKEIMKWFNENRITKVEAAEALGCSEYYIDFINEEIYKKEIKK